MSAAFKPYEEPKGSQLKLFGEIETALPASAKSKGAGVAFVALAAAVSIILMGGLKLKGEYAAVQKVYEAGDNGYSITALLGRRADSAANIITVGAQVLGTEDAVLQNARDALKDLQSAEGPAAQFAADQSLGKAVDLLYQTLCTEGGMEEAKKQSLQTQNSDFLSTEDIINHIANHDVNAGVKQYYNEEARAYNKAAAGFPAGLLAGIWGCEEVELFA